MINEKIAATVFTGFLGSGKTTIISGLVDELQTAGKQIIYIKNEIGNENIDAQILKGKHIQTKELLNGCICCTLVGPFIHAIDEIIDSFKPDRIIIEASGAADPAALALMIDSHPRLWRDGVLAVIDVVNFDGYIDLSITAQNQTKFTDLIVFNKVEQVDLPRKQAVVGYVRELNDHSPIVEAPQGTLAASVAFGVSTKELGELLIDEGFNQHTANHMHHPHEHHLQQDGIESFSLEPGKQATPELIQSFLDQLPSAVYRVKGVFTTPSKTAFVVNKVGRRTAIEETKIPELTSLKNTLVLIGFHINQYQTKIAKELSSLTQN